jgi:DNA-binding transcriptional LysR family regulator
MKKDYTIPRGQLDGVEAFLRVAERRSFRAAADDLGVSPSAVSQTVKALEARVGVPLLARTTRSVGLTEAGERFLAGARPAFEDLSDAFDAARSFGERPAGLLRITLPTSVIPFVIAPVIAGFCAAYPSVEVEVVGDNNFVDLAESGFDAGIRLGESLAADAIAVRLSPPFDYCVAGAPDYFDAHGVPAHPRDLRHHRCIRIRMPRGGLFPWGFEEAGRMFDVAVDGPLITNESGLAKAAAMGGAGLAYLAVPQVEEELADGRLRLALEAFACRSPGVFLYYPSRGQVLPKLRVFIDWLRTHLPPVLEPLART